MKKLTKAITQLLDEQPLFGMTCYGLELEEFTAPTMATDGHKLYYNPEFVAKLPVRELLFVLCHEAMHVLAGHPWRFKEFLDAEGDATKQAVMMKLNMAADYNINLSLTDIDDFYPMPDGLLDQQYRNDKGQPENMEIIYRKLPDIPTFQIKIQQQGPGDPDCLPAPKDSDEAEAQARIAEIITVAKARGDLPGNMQEVIEDFLDSKKSWINSLLSLATQVRRTDYTMKRPNRRYLHTGLYMPVLEAPGIGPVVVGIDTSGSVGNDELSMYGGQIQSVITTLNPSEVFVMYCDAEVNNVEHLSAGEPFNSLKATGRGGTSFDPVFQEVKKRAITPDVLIYLTDMECNFPEQPNYPVIWVSSNPGHTAPWGTTVEIV